MTDRWNEHALDDLAGDVEDIKDELQPLRPLPALVAEHSKRFDRMREDLRDAAAEEVRRVEALHERLNGLDAKMDAGFASLRRATRNAAEDGAREGTQSGNFKENLKMVLAAAGGIGIPIAGVIVAIHFGG